jgi:PAS domain S-box-containing protein
MKFFKGETEEINNELSLKQRELEEKNRELHLLKQKLEGLQEKNDKIYENSPTGYFTFNKIGIILSLNKTGSEQLSASKEQLIAHSFADLIVPEHRSKFNMHLENVFTYNKRHICEVKIERKDKSLFYALLESVPSNENGNEISFCRSKWFSLFMQSSTMLLKLLFSGIKFVSPLCIIAHSSRLLSKPKRLSADLFNLYAMS